MDPRDALIHILTEELADVRVQLEEYKDMCNVRFVSHRSTNGAPEYGLKMPDGYFYVIGGISVYINTGNAQQVPQETACAVALWLGIKPVVCREIAITLRGNSGCLSIRYSPDHPSQFVLISYKLYPYAMTARNAERIIRKIAKRFIFTVTIDDV